MSINDTLVIVEVTAFLKQFGPAGALAQVMLDCRYLKLVDYSAIAALDTLRERYSKAGKHLRVLYLSLRSKKWLRRAWVQHE